MLYFLIAGFRFVGKAVRDSESSSPFTSTSVISNAKRGITGSLRKWGPVMSLWSRFTRSADVVQRLNECGDDAWDFLLRIESSETESHGTACKFLTLTECTDDRGGFDGARRAGGTGGNCDAP